MIKTYIFNCENRFQNYDDDSTANLNFCTECTKNKSENVQNESRKALKSMNLIQKQDGDAWANPFRTGVIGTHRFLLLFHSGRHFNHRSVNGREIQQFGDFVVDEDRHRLPDVERPRSKRQLAHRDQPRWTNGLVPSDQTTISTETTPPFALKVRHR